MLQFSTKNKKYRYLDKMKKNSELLFLLLFLLITTFKSIGEERKLVYQIDIKKEINNTTRIYLRNGLEEAKLLGADAVLLHMNTYGGLL